MAELSWKTLCRIFFEQAALREKEFGIWQQYREHVAHFALGLKALGFFRDDHLAIISENCREWLYAERGTIAIGGVTVGVYPTSPYPEVQYGVDHADAEMTATMKVRGSNIYDKFADDIEALYNIIGTLPIYLLITSHFSIMNSTKQTNNQQHVK